MSDFQSAALTMSFTSLPKFLRNCCRRASRLIGKPSAPTKELLSSARKSSMRTSTHGAKAEMSSG